MEQTFKEYLKQSRWDFAKVAEKYPVEKHLELRTAIDSLLIAYDQAVHQALTIPDVVGQRELLIAFVRWVKANDRHIVDGDFSLIEDYIKSL